MKKLWIAAVVLVVFIWSSSCTKDEVPEIVFTDCTEQDFLGTWQLVQSDEVEIFNGDTIYILRDTLDFDNIFLKEHSFSLSYELDIDNCNADNLSGVLLLHTELKLNVVNDQKLKIKETLRILLLPVTIDKVYKRIH